MIKKEVCELFCDICTMNNGKKTESPQTLIPIGILNFKELDYIIECNICKSRWGVREGFFHWREIWREWRNIVDVEYLVDNLDIHNFDLEAQKIIKEIESE